MTIHDAVMLSLAAAAGGALNSVAGGGTFLAFPALLFAGVPPVPANATATMALWPGAAGAAFAYRTDVDTPRAMMMTLAGVSVVGGALGAWLLLNTPNAAFEKIIPPLLLFASIVFSASAWINARLRGFRAQPSRMGRTLSVACVLQFAISVYGGYFGAGIGILMIAAWSALGVGNIHGVNGLRSFLGMSINGVALLLFIVTRSVAWAPGLLMAICATATGYFGAAYARRLPPLMVRRGVLVIAWFMTGYFFWKFYG